MPQLSDREKSDSVVDLQRDIVAFLSLYDRALFSVEIQKIIYLADLYFVEVHNGRMTDATFKSTMYGPHSSEVQDTLDLIKKKLPTKSGIRKGKRNPKYFYKGTVKFEHNGKNGEIESIYDSIKSFDEKVLTEISKESWPSKSTPTGDELDFRKYRKQLDENLADPVFYSASKSEPSYSWLHPVR